MFITHEGFNHPKIKYAFFTSQVPGTHRYFCKHDDHLQNRKIIAEIFGSSDLSLAQQEHTNQVILVDNYGNTSIADGQVTNKPGIALAVATADCVPILLVDAENCVIATAHAGWRGARINIVSEIVKKMKEIGAEEITAIIGPCIKQHCYEVDQVFYNNFTQESETYKKFFTNGERDKHYMFDLTAYVKNKLALAGISNILDIDENTYEDEKRFLSFRRFTHNPQGKMGNIISVIMLKE